MQRTTNRQILSYEWKKTAKRAMHGLVPMCRDLRSYMGTSPSKEAMHGSEPMLADLKWYGQTCLSSASFCTSKVTPASLHRILMKTRLPVNFRSAWEDNAFFAANLAARQTNGIDWTWNDRLCLHLSLIPLRAWCLSSECMGTVPECENRLRPVAAGRLSLSLSSVIGRKVLLIEVCIH